MCSNKGKLSLPPPLCKPPLYNRINLRVDKMLEAGLLEEAEDFYKDVGSLRNLYKCHVAKNEFQKAKMFDSRKIETTFINKELKKK